MSAAAPGYAASAPSVAAVSPSWGPTAGGNQVMVNGSQFVRNATTVTFGTVSVSPVHVVSSSQLWVFAPAHPAGIVDVRVTTVSGTSSVQPVDQYTYLSAPTVTAVDPDKGSTNGGTPVTITGTNFVGVTRVMFGGNGGSNVVVAPTATSLTVTAPPHSAGAVDVQVVTSYYSSARVTADRYTYIAPPSITSIVPNVGATSGATRVTVTGTSLVNFSSVTFGGVPGQIQAATSTSITVLAPPHTAGVVDVQVVGAYGTSALVKADHYTYVAPPTVTSVTPNAGPASGGTRVTVTGTSFVNFSSVTFGGVPGQIQAGTSTSITVVAPAHAAGTVDIQVVGTLGNSSPSSGDQYTYVNPARPTVTSIAPAGGSTRGGTQVTVTGTTFISVSAVTFGGRSAGIVSITPTSLVVVSPTRPAGVVDVQVVTAFGTSPAVPADRFTYIAPAPPTVTAVDPGSGSTVGGTRVTVTGTNFTNVTSVAFGGIAGAGILVGSPTSLSVTTPAHDAGSVDVVVTTAYGTSPAVTADQFTFVPLPTVTSVSPSFGAARGGTLVNVQGANFVDAIEVLFDGIPVPVQGMYSPTSIGITPPPHAAGVVDIQVRTTHGLSAITPADRYTYVSTPAWSDSPPLKAPEDSGFWGHPTSVSCPTSDFCVMVDTSGNASVFDGTSWTPIANIQGNDLTSVSCPTTTFCIAVDVSGNAYAFDGATWSPPGGATIDTISSLTSVSCASTTFCVAVDASGYEVTFDGATWSAPNRINPVHVDASLGEMDGLNSVSCPTAAFCVAVSQDGHAITFDGSGWSSPVELVPMGLVSVSCASASFCVAVHAVGEVVTYSDGEWSSPTLVDSNGGTTAVSCPTADFCVVVDNTGHVATFNGTSWTDPDNLPQIDDTPFGGLATVSCTSAGFCATFAQNGLMMTYDGTNWSAPVKVDVKNQPTGVSCVSPTFCVAVDSANYVYIWNGTKWNLSANLNSNEYWGLNAVSCASTTFCVVVDGSGNAYTYNGTEWSPPTLVSPYTGISSISCLSESWCMAVDGNGNFATYNGTTWSDPLVVTPWIDSLGDEGGNPGLTSVSCPTKDFCVAVDQIGNAYTYSGGTWSTATSIDGATYLNGVSCASPTFCVTVGYVTEVVDNEEIDHGVAAVYDGASWSPATSFTEVERMWSVSCPTDSFCMAVDHDQSAFTFDGSTWSPAYPLSNQGLASVSCSNPAFCAAVAWQNASLWY